MPQESLFEEKTTDHSNRGKGFEKEIEAVNEVYLLRGLADILKSPTEWIYIGYTEYQRIYRYNPNGVATTGGGRYMKMIPSDLDFGGNGYVFDAKETKGNRFPLKNIKPHQYVRLRRSARCGNVAGCLIKFSDVDRVFFAPSLFLDEKEIALTRASFGKRRAPVGFASIHIEEFEKDARVREIKRDNMTRLWDWLKVLREIKNNVAI